MIGISFILALAPEVAARGGPATLEVDASACPRVSGSALAQRLELEIRSVLEASPGSRFRVTLSCDRASSQISVEDPLTNKGVRRQTGPLAADDPDPARTAALSAAQLFYVSWEELNAPLLPVNPAPFEAPPTVTVRSARGATQDRRNRARPNDLMVAGGLRWRRVERPVLVGVVELRYGRWLAPAWGVGARIGAEFGQAGRTLGEVRVVDALAGGGATFRVPAWGSVALGVEMGGDVVFQHLSGRATAPDVQVDTALGVTGQLGGAVLVALRGFRFLGQLGFEVGYAFRGPVAAIEGDRSVRADGVVLGGTIRLGLPR